MPLKNLNLYTSNRLEILADKLTEVLSTPLASPIEPEIIVVQSKGMERWISMEIAQRFGICANVRFPFPNAFIYEMIGKVIPDLPEASPFDPRFLAWKIMKILPTFIDMPDFESIKNYLDNGGFDLKGFQLAERIADLFDQYLLYRPDWIFRWEKGEADHWQALLWRKLAMGNEHLNRAALGKKLVELLQKQGTNSNNFPQRVAVFGISALPLFHIQILAAISQFTEINLFLMNPCQEYWFDILSDREIKRVTDRYRDSSLPEVDTHAEKGNSLLASMGSLGRDFLGMIYDFEAQESADFIAPENDTLLSHIQSDILNLRDRHESSTKTTISENESSIQVHSSHSPMREIEVLQDQLLKMFEQNPGLLPKDILVMAPDIEVYAPYIQAVFDLPLDDPRRIPFSITDRNIGKESQVIETFLAILDLWNSRFGAAQVMTILEYSAVRLKFGISETEINMIRHWITDTRIRWGIDENNRRDIGLPATSENTWQAGLKRLLVGYAMPGQGEEMFANILPYDHIEGSEAVVLGNFIEFTDRLFKTVDSLGQLRTLEQWSDFLQKLIERFFEMSEHTQNQLMVIWQALNDLVTIQNESGFTGKIDIQIIRNYLKHHLEKASFGYGFMTGGITFCSMLPMRSIPFKVICLIGMNDTAYPRQEPKLGFNLIAKHPRPGDRSRRKDDRYLFLEALLSAREKFYISYVGQSIQDNSTIPPSVLVSELLDYVRAGFEIAGSNILSKQAENSKLQMAKFQINSKFQTQNYKQTKSCQKPCPIIGGNKDLIYNIIEHLVTKHRLQAFSSEYFKGDKKLFSYSSEHFQAAKRLVEPSQAPLPFISTGLSVPGDEWKQVAIADLSRFFLNPAKFLLNKRLGIYLGEEISILDENESFVMEHLDRYLLEQNLLEKQLDGKNLTEFLKTTKAAGTLPHGTVGDCVYENLSSGVEHFVRQSQQYIQAAPLEPLSVDLSIADFHLFGQIDGINSDRQLRYRFAKVKGKDRLRTWIDHLILNCIAAENYPRVSLLIGLNPDSRDPQWAAWEFSAIDNSREILERLLTIYWDGLIKPIHFFPESSWECASRVLEKNKPVDDALKNARNVWTGSDYNRGECEDVNYQLCFKNRDPIDEEFQDLAIEIFKLMVEVQKKIS